MIFVSTAPAILPCPFSRMFTIPTSATLPHLSTSLCPPKPSRHPSTTISPPLVGHIKHHTDYSTGILKRKLRRARLGVIAGTILSQNVPLRANIRLGRKSKKLKHHLLKLRPRTMRITTSSIELNKDDKRTSLRDFSFTTIEITRNIVPFFEWDRTDTAGKS